MPTGLFGTAQRASFATIAQWIGEESGASLAFGDTLKSPKVQDVFGRRHRVLAIAHNIMPFASTRNALHRTARFFADSADQFKEMRK